MYTYVNADDTNVKKKSCPCVSNVISRRDPQMLLDGVSLSL